MSKAKRELPKQLTVTESYEIGELLTSDGVTRILLAPSECYLNDEIVQLEAVIDEIVKRYNFAPKLFQLHHQSKKDFSSEMVSQSEIYCQEQMNIFWKETAKEHPLPEGFQWLICNEDSEHFVKCANV